MKKTLLIALLLPSLAMAASFKQVASGKKLNYVGATCAGVSFSIVI